MDFMTNPVEIMSIASVVLLLLLTSNRALDLNAHDIFEEDMDNSLQRIRKADLMPILDTDVVTSAALHNFRLCNVFSLFDADLG